MTLYPCGPCTRLPRGQYCSEKCRREQNVDYLQELIAEAFDIRDGVAPGKTAADAILQIRSLHERVQKSQNELNKLRDKYAELLSTAWAFALRGE